MPLRSICFLLPAILASALACAQEYQLKGLRIADPYARATMPQQPSGGAYLTIENRGNTADRLLAAASPVAKSVEIHTMSMQGNVMKMREVGALEIKPAATITMQPGNGYHLMLIGLRQPLKAGDKVPLMLKFEKAGKTEVTLTVRDLHDEHRMSGAHDGGAGHAH